MIGITRAGQRGAKGRIWPAGRSLPRSVLAELPLDIEYSMKTVIDSARGILCGYGCSQFLTKAAILHKITPITLPDLATPKAKWCTGASELGYAHAIYGLFMAGFVEHLGLRSEICSLGNSRG